MGDPVGEPRQKKRFRENLKWVDGVEKGRNVKGFLASRLVLLIDATTVQLRK